MTTIQEELNSKRLIEFKNHLEKNQITLTHAAEMLDISKGQLSHILKGERNLSEQVYYRMKEIIKNKKPQLQGGIYGLFFEDELIYIGQTKNFSRRWYNHKSDIKNKVKDNQPLHFSSNLNIDKITMKIFYDCKNTFLYPIEISDLEESLIRVCLPKWNSHIKTLINYKFSKQEKIEILADSHPISIENLSRRLENWKIKLTDVGEEQVHKAINYSKEEILSRATTIVSRWKNSIEEDNRGE